MKLSPHEFDAATTEDGAACLVALKDIVKSYGSTIANSGISLSINPGDVIGLVGGNGAGKSTLMKILCGGASPDSGRIAFSGTEIRPDDYGPAEAQALGIRMVHQELSLCGNLSVAENFFLELPQGARFLPGWRSRYRDQARTALDAVFPGSAIDVDSGVANLTIGERQIVEIARSAAVPGVRLIVLDEPTSSLDQDRSRQLRAYIRRRSAEGVAFIFISHKLQEVIDIATKVAVLRNGQMVWNGAASEASIEKLVQLMGGDVNAIKAHGTAATASAAEEIIRIGGKFTAGLDSDVAIRRGEIVGLAGLEGSGQKELLEAIFAGRRFAKSGVEHQQKIGYIAGDRPREGVFQQWSVLSNISISKIAGLSPLAFISDSAERSAAGRPADDLRLARNRFDSNILELSGGNQQKALVARALVDDAPVILLDDPTRGVDIATKQDFYRICNEIAAAGRTLVWLSTEEAELLTADRVLVFSGGRIVEELVGEEITEEAIVAASFVHQSTSATWAGEEKAKSGRYARWAVHPASFVSLAVVLAVMGAVNPATASVFGLDLLLMPALSLVLVAIAQMFVVGGSEIDLGVGAFAGLISVLSATLLYDQPGYGVFAITAALAAYAALGALITARKIPAIVVTLGASFIWLGIGYSIQPTPGGSSPDWLSAAFGWSLASLPTSVILIIAVGVVAVLIDRTPLGVVLRGFGANANAMTKSGWRSTNYALFRYLISGLFAAAAGLSLTAINTASDINSGNSYTLLSIAAVVMGGSSLIGGIISPAGVVAGAVTLSLIGALLGVLNVSSDYNAAAQGIVLILLLAFRSMVADRRSER
ncbi:ATP-binding cassette domain-containing protein [Rhizobium jaguaris]|uniref:ATP-binding cassette domain-containing protein n=1 Tax=Rhizobium jaguaris TaxID=1312183 RepID=UPI0039BFF34E